MSLWCPGHSVALPRPKGLQRRGADSRRGLREKLVVCAITSAIGAITGAVIVLGARALVDLPTTIIALVSLALLWRYKIPEPIMVTVSGIVGLILWPLLHG
jgi:hypothetical protein